MEETHESNQVVDKDKDEGDDCKVEQVSPVGKLALLGKLVVGNHNTYGKNNRQHHTSKDNENILGDETPGRVTGSKKCGLSRYQVSRQS